MCAGQPLITSNENYENDFLSLDQDEYGNVSFEVLLTYLVSKFNFTNEVVQDILEKTDRKKIEALNKRQFKKMMTKLEGIHIYLKKRSNNVFNLYDLYNYGFINRHELLEVDLINSLRVPLG